MKVYFAADHAGFELKAELLNFVRGELGFEVEDCGAHVKEPTDDYPEIIARAAKKLGADSVRGVESRAIVIGASGQGEAMAANRFKGVRCALYYGPAAHAQKDVSGTMLSMIGSMREHNDSNALALGARFISPAEVRDVVKEWLETAFSGNTRHSRRNRLLDEIV